MQPLSEIPSERRPCPWAPRVTRTAGPCGIGRGCSQGEAAGLGLGFWGPHGRRRPLCRPTALLALLKETLEEETTDRMRGPGKGTARKSLFPGYVTLDGTYEGRREKPRPATPVSHAARLDTLRTALAHPDSSIPAYRLVRGNNTLSASLLLKVL